MAVNIPEELRAFGITSKDFSEKKRDLSKSAEKKVKDNDVIWGLFEDLTKKAASYEMLQMLYWNMAIFKDKLGQNSFEYQQKSHKSRLLDLEQKGMQMPQKYGAASSYGKKYALGNLFLIDDTQDSDATNSHGKNGTTKKKLTNESLAKAKEYIAKGGSIDTIKNKYVVSAKQEELLQATL